MASSDGQGSTSTVAISGAAGFLGPHLVHGFRARGARVLPLVRALEGGSPAGARVLEQACADPSALAGVDAFVHAAAVRLRNGVDAPTDHAVECRRDRARDARLCRRRCPALRLRELRRGLRLPGAPPGDGGAPVRAAHVVVGREGRGRDARPPRRARSAARAHGRAAGDRLRSGRPPRHARQDGVDDPRLDVPGGRLRRQRAAPRARRRRRRGALARGDARGGGRRRLHPCGAGDDDAVGPFGARRAGGGPRAAARGTSRSPSRERWRPRSTRRSSTGSPSRRASRPSTTRSSM